MLFVRSTLLTLALLALAGGAARADLIPSCPPGTHVESTMGPGGHPLRGCVPDAAPVDPAVDPAPAPAPVDPTPPPPPPATDPTPPAPAPAAPAAPASGMCSVSHAGSSALFAGLTLVIAALALSRRR